MDIADKKSPLKHPFKAFDHREFLCGWGSAFINITMTYPLYKTIFRQVSWVLVGLSGVLIEFDSFEGS